MSQASLCSHGLSLQNNETEALRSWREALDQIYYHNAYKLPANYKPKNQTEKALQDSLRDMELQCKERVDLFDTIKNSRDEAKSRSNDSLDQSSTFSRKSSNGSTTGRNPSLGQGSIAPSSYSSISRPPIQSHRSSQSTRPSESSSRMPSESMPPPAYSEKASTTLKPPQAAGTRPSRSPSPEKRSVMRSTLRPEKDRNGNPARTLAQSMRPRPPKSASTAAALAWPGQLQPGLPTSQTNGRSTSLGDLPGASARQASVDASLARQSQDNHRSSSPDVRLTQQRSSGPDLPSLPIRPRPNDTSAERQPPTHHRNDIDRAIASKPPPPPPPPHRTRHRQVPDDIGLSPTLDKDPSTLPPPPSLPSYRKEYPPAEPIDPRKVASIARNPPGQDREKVNGNSGASLSRSKPTVTRRPVPGSSASPSARRQDSFDHSQSSSSEVDKAQARRKAKNHAEPLVAELPGHDMDSKASNEAAWDARVKHLMDNLPKGVDKDAAKSIFNEIVIKGDEVHWDDVAGLDVAKNALKEAVVYPFLRPDLFMGLREPARGMLLFGPPGTGKTMLARAVATESHSTFFAISASSLTSKYLGESEKLVRALFSLAKALTPAIIFVDEIDSLLSARAGSGEHEATRRIKTEFLIQWSDLAKAAAGREQTDGDASRVLVLAATNLPWAIDEAARRRFVRRQYIPLPETHVREEQLRRLVSAQKHSLNDADFRKLVNLTDGK